MGTKAELQLTDMAEVLQGDWVLLGRQLGLKELDLHNIAKDYSYVSEQALVMLHLWIHEKKGDACGNDLERALRKIDREDVIQRCMYNIEEVKDEKEREIALRQIDRTLSDVDIRDLETPKTQQLKDQLERNASLDVDFDEQDLMKESESIQGSGSEKGSTKDLTQAPINEDIISAEHKPKDDGIVLEEIIKEIEVSKVEGMDDRASLSSEEGFIIHGGKKDSVIKKGYAAPSYASPLSAQDEDLT